MKCDITPCDGVLRDAETHDTEVRDAETHGATPRDADIPIRLFGLVPDSIVDGPGLRYAVFVQGCSHACPGCHNPESQPPGEGELRRVGEVYDDIRRNGLVHAVTLSGGEPFEQPAACAALARLLRADGYGVWAYTGYLYEDLLRRASADDDELSTHIEALLRSIDVLVDGPYVEARHSWKLKWRGSTNQRLIDVPRSLEAGEVVTWHPPTFEIEKPPSW